MVGIIICEVGTIICDIGTINVKFYLLKARYLHGYCRITLFNWVILQYLHSFCGYGTHSIDTIKCDISTIICDVGTIKYDIGTI